MEDAGDGGCAVALMVVPGPDGARPAARAVRNLGIADWYVGIWLAHTAFGLPLGIFLLRNFFITLPRDLIEAARVDGASNLRIFLRVVVPLSVPTRRRSGSFSSGPLIVFFALQRYSVQGLVADSVK